MNSECPNFISPKTENQITGWYQYFDSNILFLKSCRILKNWKSGVGKAESVFAFP